MPVLTALQIATDLNSIRQYVIPTGQNEAIPVFKEADLLELFSKWGLGETDRKPMKEDSNYY